METVLKTIGLTKSYGKQKAVDGVSIEVRKGDIYGFVGKNGAGKTTFIRLVLGLARADSGSVELFPGEEPMLARRRTGSLVESPALYTNMTARENLEMCCTIIGADKSQADGILELTGLSGTGRKKAGNFSLGMKQRLGIGMALVGDPELLILDEPINGLDPTGIAEIRELLLRLRNERGKTIFISSHILGELEKISTRYGIISRGRLAEELTAEELKKRCGLTTILKTDDPAGAAEIIRRVLGSDKVEARKNGIVAVSAEIKNIGELTNALYGVGITVTEINTSDSDAENYFIRKMEEG